MDDEFKYDIEIQTWEDFHSIIEDGIIWQGFNVYNPQINSLKGVKEIRPGKYGSVHFRELIDIGELEVVDCSFSFFGNVKSLNNLRYVGGELRFGAPLECLGNLEEIKGDLRPYNQNLKSLGKLRKVSGTVDLRGMVDLTDLGNLREVGGNLNLVKSLKGQYNLNNVKVEGRIIYWNKEPRYFIHKEYLKIGLPPVWEDEYTIYNVRIPLIPNAAQLDFYLKFKENFEKGVYIDIGHYKNYIKYFTVNVLEQYKKTKNFNELKKTFEILRNEYPDFSYLSWDVEVDEGSKLGIEEYKKVLLERDKYEIWKKVLSSKLKSIKPLIKNHSSDDKLFELLNIGFKNQFLTKFGVSNSKVILERLILKIREIEATNNEAFESIFNDIGAYYKSTHLANSFDPLYYRKFFKSQGEFERKLSIHNQRIIGLFPERISHPIRYPTIAEFAIQEHLKNLIRDVENEIREERNLPKIGEGWISETELFYKIKQTFPNYKVIHHAKTDWLGLQHVDIYFPDLKIAIEYQGQQHTEPIDFFGGEESFQKNLENDKLKKEKCLSNNCILIEVFPNYDFQELTKIILDAIRIKKSHHQIKAVAQ